MNIIQYWFRNARYRSLAQSVMPAVLAAVMASRNEGFIWWTALLAVFGVAMAHLAMNLADDWFDYRVDMLGDRDKVTRQGFRAMMVKYPYLSSGEQSLKSTAVAIAASAFAIIGFAMSTVVGTTRHIASFIGVLSLPSQSCSYVLVYGL